MPNETKLSDLAKEIEYLKERKKLLETLVTPDGKTTLLMNEYEIYFDDDEAEEAKQMLITIIDHGILRLSGELRKEI